MNKPPLGSLYPLDPSLRRELWYTWECKLPSCMRAEKAKPAYICVSLVA